MSTIPTFDVRALDPAALGAAFAEYGFVALVGHDVDRPLVEPAYAAVRRLFALPDTVKRRYHLPGAAGARGYTPFRTEKAKDQHEPDLKEFWHVGRELSPDDPRYAHMQPNVWPEEVPDLRPSLLALYGALDALGARVLSGLAIYLGLSPGWFDDKIDHGNSILRPLHYPPIGAAAEPGVRSAAHEDINLITLLSGATAEGLELLRRDGTWMPVHTGFDTIVVDSGDMLQNVTNGLYKSTTHRVVNPSDGGSERFSIPCFIHARGDVDLSPLPSCVARTGGVARYPSISAGAYLEQRLREIGLA